MPGDTQPGRIQHRHKRNAIAIVLFLVYSALALDVAQLVIQDAVLAPLLGLFIMALAYYPFLVFEERVNPYA